MKYITQEPDLVVSTSHYYTGGLSKNIQGHFAPIFK